jgi:hypothetical protein
MFECFYAKTVFFSTKNLQKLNKIKQHFYIIKLFVKKLNLLKKIFDKRLHIFIGKINIEKINIEKINIGKINIGKINIEKIKFK